MLGFALTFLGAACLSLATHRHYVQLFPRKTDNGRSKLIWRVCGLSILTFGLVTSIDQLGVALGITAFVAYLNVGIFGVALGLSVHSSRTKI